jgi:hypothetical protein
MRNILLILTLSIFYACRPTGTTKTSTDSNIDSKELMQTFALTTFERHKIDTFEDNRTDTSFFKVTYPSSNDATFNRWMQQFALGSDSISLEEAAQLFLEAHGEVYKDHGSAYPSWQEDYQLTFTRLQEAYWGLNRQYYGYTGGAHGMYYTHYLHIDPSTKELIPIDSLLNQATFDQLTKLAETRFRKDEGLTQDTPLDQGYFFENGTFYLPSQFTFEKDSIAFIYGIYEIKPYSEGETVLRLAYKDIDPHLTPFAKQIIKQAPISNDK